jgi:hypothetical protein
MKTKKYFNWILALSLCCVVGAACSDDPPTNDDKNNMPEMGRDLPDSQDLGADAAPDLAPDMCQPRTTCEAGTCGMLQDGCGGMLDCGACQCEAGQPVKLECGQCNLGALDCAGAEPSCQQPSWPEFAKIECKNTIYVVAGAPADAAGTREAPMGDLSAAMQRAFQLGKGSIVAIGGNGSFALNQTLQLFDETHLIGGLDATTWTHSTERPELVFTLSGQDAVAVRATNIANPTLIAGLRIRVADNPTPGGNVYGLLAHNAQALVVDRLAVQVGEGGDGQDGQDGTNGAPGGDGEDALRSPSGLLFVSAGRGGINPSCEPVGCTKNYAVFGMPDACQLGGIGGKAGFWNNTVPVSAEAGANSIDGARGGRASSSTIGDRSGGDGSDGVPQANLPAPGMGGTTAQETVEGIFKHLGVGQDGTNGARGESGGGGGGGSWCDNSASVPVGERCTERRAGPPGGGGGAGGCGGERATGGRPGGSSFGLSASFSQGMIVRASTFTAGAGGIGGDGAAGGQGGRGGVGGQGTNNVTDQMTAPFRSGDGGRGASGQPGSASGAGGGGFSFGAWCNGTTLVQENQVSFINSSAGNGGRGETSEQNGANGLSGEQFNCLP